MRLVFSLLLLFSALPACAQEGGLCPPFEAPEVTLEAVSAPPKIDTSQQLGYLMVMASKNSPNFSSTSHEFPVGLTAASLSLNASYKVRMRQIAGTNLYCAQISALHLRYGFPDTVVYLAHELPSMSCGFKSVLAHELQHVAIDQNFSNTLGGPLEKAMKALAEEIGVLRTASSENAKESIRRAVDAKIGSLGKELAYVRQKEQMKIDSKDEYSRLSRACDGELADLLAQYAP